MLGIRQSVGRTGICYDCALAESFFAAMKNERGHRTQYPTRERAGPSVTGRSPSLYSRFANARRVLLRDPGAVPRPALCAAIATHARAGEIC